jgi:hypothetical protein
MTKRSREKVQRANLILSHPSPRKNQILTKVAVNHWSNQKMTTRVILIMTMKAWNGTSWRRRLRLLMKMLQIAKI